MSNEQAALCAMMRDRGFRVERDPNPGPRPATLDALIKGKHTHVLAWMPDTATITDARTFGDLPVWLSSYYTQEDAMEVAEVLFCGGLYVFWKVFHKGQEVHPGSGIPPEDPNKPLRG